MANKVTNPLAIHTRVLFPPRFWNRCTCGLTTFPMTPATAYPITFIPSKTFLRPRSLPILNLDTFARGFNVKHTWQHLSFTVTLSVRGVQIQKCRGGFSNWFRFKTVHFQIVTATYSVCASLLGTGVEFRAVISRDHSRLARTSE